MVSMLRVMSDGDPTCVVVCKDSAPTSRRTSRDHHGQSAQHEASR
jgi:hypothetical protein